VYTVGGHQIDNGEQYVSTNGCIQRAGYTQWATYVEVHLEEPCTAAHEREKRHTSSLSACFD
jgi:hypothetical protein